MTVRKIQDARMWCWLSSIFDGGPAAGTNLGMRMRSSKNHQLTQKRRPCNWRSQCCVCLRLAPGEREGGSPLRRGGGGGGVGGIWVRYFFKYNALRLILKPING